MNQPGTVLKKKLALNVEFERTLEAFAVRDGFGKIDQAATIFKFERRQVLKTAKPWEATANPFKEFPGTSSAAPRSSGPAARTPAEVGPMGQDKGNAQVVATPLMTSDGTIFAPAHNPARAAELLREVIRNTRRAQGLA